MASSSSPEPVPLRVLSFDGGAFRGYVGLRILLHLNEHLRGIRPCEFFDLICGTGNGGLIALMLGRLRMTTQETITAYLEMGPKIFGARNDVLRKIVQGKNFELQALRDSFRDIVALHHADQRQEIELLDLDPKRPCYTFVTTVNKADKTPAAPLLLRTYEKPPGGLPGAREDYKWSVVEAAMATFASPFYFEPLSISPRVAGYEPSVFQDAGASGFNNPAKAALQEIDKIVNFEGRRIGLLVTFGTGFISLAPNKPTTEEREVKIAQAAQSLQTEVHGQSPERIRELAVQLVDGAERSSKDAIEVRRELKRITELLRLNEDVYFRHDPDRGLGDIGFADYGRQGSLDAIVDDYLLKSDDVERCTNKMKALERQNPSRVETDLR